MVELARRVVRVETTDGGGAAAGSCSTFVVFAETIYGPSAKRR